jgi:hypothetical protein
MSKDMFGASDRLSAFCARTYPIVVTLSMVQNLKEKSLELIV